MNRNGRLFALPHLAITFAVSVLFLLCEVNAGAQASRVGATLEGTIRDSSGAVVPSARVTLKNSLTDQFRIVTTDRQGFFRADELALGTYEIRVEQASFAPYRQAGVALRLRQTVRLNITLGPRSAPVATESHPPMQTYVEEFFLSDAVRNEDKGELQFTFATDSRQGLGSNVALQVEYGLTRRLQFDFELPYAFSASENSEVAAAWSTTSVGFQYQFIRSDSPFALVAGIAVGIPMKGSASWSLEPTILAAKTFKKLQVHASFVAEMEQWKPSFQYNVASVYPVGRRWFPTLEFNGRRLEVKNAFYLTPGLYRHFGHRVEIGIGVPAGLGGIASRVGLVGKINWEFGGDSDDRPGG